MVLDGAQLLAEVSKVLKAVVCHNPLLTGIAVVCNHHQKRNACNHKDARTNTHTHTNTCTSATAHQQ